MRAAAILGLGCSAKDLKPFQAGNTQKIEWRIGMPGEDDAADIVLLFGGDGTIHRHLGELVRLAVPVLVVPTGSGNDFARALGIKHGRDSLAAWQKFQGSAGNVQPIDLGVVFPSGRGDEASAPGGIYFCCVAGVGLDSDVARRANQLPRWLRGHGGYVLSLAPAIFRFAALPMKILAADDDPNDDRQNDGRRNNGDRNADRQDGHHPNWNVRSDQPTLLAAFANARLYGGGMKIAPEARMDDGRLDICIIGGVNSFKLLCMFPTVYSGRHLKIREVSYFRSPRARIETGRPLDVYADGEYICQTPVEIGVQPSALRVVVP